MEALRGLSPPRDSFWIAGLLPLARSPSYLFFNKDRTTGQRFGAIQSRGRGIPRIALSARNVLLAYARSHPETTIPLERWYRVVKAANWASMDYIRHAAPKSKVLNRDRVRFEIAGGNYPLIAAFDFRRQIAFVKFVGSHAEYDNLTVAKF